MGEHEPEFLKGKKAPPRDMSSSIEVLESLLHVVDSNYYDEDSEVIDPQTKHVSGFAAYKVAVYLRREVGGRKYCQECVDIFIEGKGLDIEGNNYHSYVQCGGLIKSTVFANLLANHIYRILNKLQNDQTLSSKFLTPGVNQEDVLKGLSVIVVQSVFPGIDSQSCAACRRPISELILIFLGSLIRTILAGVEKSLNNQYLDGLLSRKMSRNERFNQRHGHKERVFNPTPLPTSSGTNLRVQRAVKGFKSYVELDSESDMDQE